MELIFLIIGLVFIGSLMDKYDKPFQFVNMLPVLFYKLVIGIIIIIAVIGIASFLAPAIVIFVIGYFIWKIFLKE